MDDDLTQLEGTWKILTLTVGGNVVPESATADARVVMEGERFTTTIMGTVHEGSFVIDPAATPKQITLNFDGGPEAGKSHIGIYEVGGDALTLCLTATGPRPTEFSSPAGSPIALETLAPA